jgi:hypothetical protein
MVLALFFLLFLVFQILLLENLLVLLLFYSIYKRLSLVYGLELV